MPPHTAETMRASASGSSSPTSGVRAGASGSPKFAMTSEMPHRLAMATPFQPPSPWWASAYPRSRKTLTGASASVSFVSCMRSTSGRARSSHQVTLSSRALRELTFQVAMRTDVDYPAQRGARLVPDGDDLAPPAVGFEEDERALGAGEQPRAERARLWCHAAAVARAGGQQVLLLAADRARGRVHEQRPLILERTGEEAEGQLAGARFRETEDVDLRIDRYTGVKRAARATPRTT